MVGLEQDAVGDAHLANVVEERSLSDLDQFLRADVHSFC